MNIHFVRGDVLRNVQSRLIERYGGLPGVRDANLLESALPRPRHLEHYENEVRIPLLAAVVCWAILRNHPFVDGNKRAAFAALCIFLDMNGYELTCTEVEETAMVIRAAAGEIEEPEWTAWVESVVLPKRLDRLNPFLKGKRHNCISLGFRSPRNSDQSGRNLQHRCRE